MRYVPYVAASAVVAVPLLVLSAVAFRCNLRRYRTARVTAPLACVDLSKATVAGYAAPKRWPKIDDVADPREAAAYAALADDHSLFCAVAGEVLLVVGGAALGTQLADFSTSPGQFVSAAVSMAAAGVGIVLRLLATRHWEIVQRRYVDRYTELTAERTTNPPAAPPPPPPRRGLFAWLRR